MKPDGTLLLKRHEIAALLNIEECMEAVEQAFKLYAERALAGFCFRRRARIAIMQA